MLFAAQTYVHVLSFRYHLGMEPTVPCRSSLLCRSLEVYSSLQFSVWSLVWYTRPWSLLAPKPTTWNMFWRMRNHSLVSAVINNTHPSPQHWPVRKEHHDVNINQTILFSWHYILKNAYWYCRYNIGQDQLFMFFLLLITRSIDHQWKW